MKPFVGFKTEFTFSFMESSSTFGSRLGDEFKDYFKTDSEIVKFNYLREGQIESVKSASLKKTDTIEGKLIGIKGQYLIFEDSTVFNVRSNEGYKVDITIN